MTLERDLVKAGGIFFILTLLSPNSVADVTNLKPFSTDGCSLFPDGTLSQQTLWLACCEAHDIAYWMGGTSDQRTKADIALKQCVTDIGEPLIAELMLNGVRVGGSPFWPTQFRWGYGWPFPRGYEPLTMPEQKEANQLLREFMLQKEANNKANQPISDGFM